MIIVAVDVTFGKDIINSARDAFRTMEEATKKETGCVQYQFSIDIHDSKIVHVFEIWESMNALEAHLKTTHMAEFQKRLGDTGAEVAIDAKVYAVDKELEFPSM